MVVLEQFYFGGVKLERWLRLAAFGSLLLAQNALSLYFYLFHPVLAGWFATDMPPLAWQANIVIHVFQTVALVFLLWVTWD
ncbi:hypothetical protein [Natronomonas sp.]|uniref:hypothetical protein n=1 Tax=Natronomonas sp. TaxID=2184060 RepID=UPI0037CAC7BD